MQRTLLLTLGLALAAPALTAQTLVAHYPFDGNADDVSDFANHATVGGAELTTGYDGTENGAYSFDGEQDSIFAPPAAHLNTPQATYAMFVKVDELIAEGEYYLFSHGGWQNRMKVSLPNHGYPVFTTNTANGIFDGDSNPDALTPGEWTHLAFVHANDTNYIYIDGQLAKFEGNEERIGGGLNSTDEVVGIGYDAVVTGSYFTGDIDDVRVYAEGLTRQQVADLYDELQMSVSVEEVAFSQLARAYPNPATDLLYLEHDLDVGEEAGYALTDATGRQVVAGPLEGARQALDVGTLAAGVYTLRITDGARAAATQVVIR